MAKSGENGWWIEIERNSFFVLNSKKKEPESRVIVFFIGEWTALN